VIKRGYLLFEMLVALAIIVVVLLIGLQGFSWHSHALVRTEVELLYGVMLAASQHAISTGMPCEIFLQDSSSYRYLDTLYQLPEGVHFGAPSFVLGPPSAPERPITTFSTWPDHRIIFYADGKVKPGALYVSDDTGSCVYAMSCAVGVVTYIRTYRYDHGVWMVVT